MNNLARQKSWGPYAVGAGIGVLETFAMATARRPLGVSSVFEQAAAGAMKAVSPRTAQRFVDAGGKPFELGWEAALVGGILAGSMASAALSGDRDPGTVPRLWEKEVSASRAGRTTAALAGGALMMFGARMAKGCTSGHGISGTMQGAASSWVFTPLMFAAGAVVATALFGRKS